ncbi:MAG: tRNA (adenosine(37)-N6)-threonylcarbamoyltransferase complex dimerization subunit type 1 TsaB [Nitrospirae bacterium]|nr:tRNA (adenosine(37)-N6)-threonylcarbamoyltransferase complex dimerization subunit type 1 TsaB [Nitrospirota bacterium]MBI5695370.1 tRNA (adenosine(37)-N6)-threonylcarbamoyltransferase complex dimerization subunit type 1 TsaB [Nitrospirota bacterium]
MKVLGIDTSTMLGAVGIVDGGELVAELRTNVEVTHSERLMLHIDGLLKSAGLVLADIDGFAVTVGPGSFTGLRIGMAAAKAMAYASGKPVAGVPTLDALADNMPYCRFQICPMLDARKKMVYAALYRQTNNGPSMIMQPSVLAPEELAAIIDRPTVFLGDGARVYRGVFEERLCCQAVFAPRRYGYPSGANVAFRGLKKIESGEAGDPMSLTPFYIRRSEAEEKAGV